jgi:hypothetical protein
LFNISTCNIVIGNKHVKPLKIPGELSQVAQTQRDISQPHISCHMHKVSITSKKPKVQTARTSPMDPIRSLQRQQIKSHMNSRRGSPAEKKEHSDYFDILRDENRKPFQVEEYEGVDDYQSEVIMSRIYSQGFRDTAYYSKAVNFEKLQAPDEKTIKEKYMFKIAPWVGQMENQKTEVTHVLGGAANNVTYVEV